MAHQAKVFVGDKPYSGIISVTYEQYTTSDSKNYRPSDRARNGLITIRRHSDDSTDWFAWAANSLENNWKAGKIEFLNENGDKIRELQWEMGFVHQYREGMPGRGVESVQPKIYEEVQIQAEIVTVDGTEHHDNWAEV